MINSENCDSSLVLGNGIIVPDSCVERILELLNKEHSG